MSHIRSPKCFYVQVDLQAADQAIWALQTAQHILMSEMSIEALRPDVLLAARFKKDQLWYRAKVLRVVDKQRVLVYYVDYGNEEIVNITEVMPLASEFVGRPALCVKCTLQDFLGDGQFDLNLTTQSMKKLTLNEERLEVRFHDSFVMTDHVERSQVYPCQIHIGEKRLHLIQEIFKSNH